MVQLPLIVVPFLSPFMLYSLHHGCVDPEWRRLDGRAGRTAIATIGSPGNACFCRYRARAGRMSWGMVCTSLVLFAGGYDQLRRLAPCETG